MQPIAPWVRSNLHYVATPPGRTALLAFLGGLTWPLGKMGLVPALLTSSTPSSTPPSTRSSPTYPPTTRRRASRRAAAATQCPGGGRGGGGGGGGSRGGVGSGCAGRRGRRSTRRRRRRRRARRRMRPPARWSSRADLAALKASLERSSETRPIREAAAVCESSVSPGDPLYYSVCERADEGQQPQGERKRARIAGTE